jgi:hypothetical protein
MVMIGLSYSIEFVKVAVAKICRFKDIKRTHPDIFDVLLPLQREGWHRER